MAGALAPPIVLASASPRRRDVLERLGFSFRVVPAPPDTEGAWEGSEDPSGFARRSAEAKAAAVAARLPEALVVAADTIVVLDGRVLGKPAGEAEARSMLARLAGREHTVHTGLALAAPAGATVAEVVVTRVVLRALADDEIAAYVATGEPLDKAGAYGIQGYGASLVAGVHGCYYNVMGLPVACLLALLGELGWQYRAPGGLLPVTPP